MDFPSASGSQVVSRESRDRPREGRSGGCANSGRNTKFRVTTLFTSPRKAGEGRKPVSASEAALIPGADQRTRFLVALVGLGQLTSLHQNARESFLAVEGRLRSSTRSSHRSPPCSHGTQAEGPRRNGTIDAPIGFAPRGARIERKRPWAPRPQALRQVTNPSRGPGASLNAPTK